VQFARAARGGNGYAAPVPSFPAPPAALDRAYRVCERLARAHAENFPVASRLLPAPVRRHLAAFYAFARVADDWADEPGRGDVATRRAALATWRGRLLAPPPEPAANGHPGDEASAIFLALGHTRRVLGLEPALFVRLLDAFERDLVQPAYDTWDDLLSYCRDSAEPVGRLVLAAAGDRDPQHAALSDRLCTALQLANHWQDLSRDEPRGRAYLPRLERARLGDARALAFAVARTRRMFDEAAPLAERAVPALRPWLRAVLAGGRTVLERSAGLGPRAFRVRPALGAVDRARIALAALAPGALPGSSFAPAFLLLAPARREALAALHALCRALDDEVDDAPEPALARRGAEHARDEVERIARGEPATAAGQRLVAAWRALPADPGGSLAEGLRELVAGLAADASGTPIASDDDLLAYCRRVGGGPGLAALPVFGRPDARAFARALGTALQRTNILRDVAADARAGRVYVPAADLARAGVPAAALAGERMPPGFRPVARALARRARAAFAEARAAIPAGAGGALTPALVMGRVYEGVLARLEADPGRAWRERVRVPPIEAAWRGLLAAGTRR
jgi:phytoene synthase